MASADSDHELEFDCIDCGLHVVSMAPPHNAERRCVGCSFLADVEDACDRAALRQLMLRRGIIG